jgi:hypothetical protein
MATVASTSTSTDVCPRCQQPLIDPFGLGWCKGCGYCRSLGEEKGTPAPKPAAPAAATEPPPKTAPRGRPVYLWITLGNVLLLALGAYLIGRFLPLRPLERALWTTIQVGAGVALMFVGQFLGVLRLAPAYPALSFKDCFIPFHLYELIGKNLRDARWSLYLCSWGLTLIVSALVFIGGLQHWFTYLPGNQNRGYYPSSR